MNHPLSGESGYRGPQFQLERNRRGFAVSIHQFALRAHCKRDARPPTVLGMRLFSKALATDCLPASVFHWQRRECCTSRYTRDAAHQVDSARAIHMGSGSSHETARAEAGRDSPN